MNFNDIEKKIKVVSDIHLEHYQTFDFEQIIKVEYNSILCLVGDIGDPFSDLYNSFIEWCSKHFLIVFIIAGNHEYYNHSIEKTNNKINELSFKYFNVHFLNNSFFLVHNKLFIGTTLWSYIPEKCKSNIQSKINDYNYIQDFDIETCNKLHIESVNFIKTTIEKYKKYYKIIVLTHHSPLLQNTSDEKFEKLETNYAFSSDQSILMKDVYAWVYGHTHYNHKNNSFKYGNTTLISNQLGYQDNYDKNYDKNFYFL